MNAILIATDFSSSATNAMNYALDLAVNENCKVYLLHVSRGDVSGAEEKLMSIERQILEEKKLSCQRLLKQGDADEEILAAIEEQKPDMVVVGMKGEGSALQRLMGTTTKKIIEKALCPVMAIPENAVFNEIKNITYATDYHESDFPALKNLADLSRPFNSKITLLHISEKASDTETELKRINKFEKEVINKTGYSNFDFKVLEGKNTEKELEEYSHRQNTDLLVVSTHFRNIIDKLFGKSITKQLSFHSSVPLMVFHHKQKPLLFIFGLAIMK